MMQCNQKSSGWRLLIQCAFAFGLMVFGCGLVLIGCGHKTGLKPPEPRRVEKVGDVIVELACDRVILEWAPVLFDSRGQPLEQPASYLVLRKRGNPIDWTKAKTSKVDSKKSGQTPTSTPTPTIIPTITPTQDADIASPTPKEILPPEYEFSLVGVVPAPDELPAADPVVFKAIRWEDINSPGGVAFDTRSVKFRIPRGFPPDKPKPEDELVPEYVYSYAVVAVDTSSVTSVPSNVVQVPWTLIPEAPTDVSATVTSQKVEIQWSQSIFDCAGNYLKNIDSYEVFRADEKEDAPFKKIISKSQAQDAASQPSTTDDTALPDSVYRYKIRALLHSVIPGEFSDIISVDTADVFPPSAPASLSGAFRGNSVSLTWRSVREADLAGYRIYRRIGETTEFKLLNPDELVKSNTYIDENVSSGQTFSYKVTSVDHSAKRNESEPGNIWQITIP